MPAAKYFRVLITDEKPLIKVTAFHLYNNDTRVDEVATVSSGFISDSNILAKLKESTPNIDSVIEINTNNFRKFSLYFKWTFSTDTNVNCFKVGFSDLESTSLQKFKLQFSLDNTNWEDIIFVGPDKKLFFTSSYSFSELKPNGECFPYCLSQLNYSPGNATGSDYKFTGALKISKDRSTILFSKKVLPENYGSNKAIRGTQSQSHGGMSGFMDGIFNKGKFYFEVSVFSENVNSASNSNSIPAYNLLNLAIVPTVNERITSAGLRTNTSVFNAIGLNQPRYHIGTYGFNDYDQQTYATYNNVLTPKTRFLPGVQHGILLDFDNKQTWFLNPNWTAAAAGKYPFTTDQLGNLAGNAFALAIISCAWGIVPEYNGDLYINFGQDPFLHAVPEGYNPGLGPRWHEVADDMPSLSTTLVGLFSQETKLFDVDNRITRSVEQVKYEIPLNIARTGNYYIKGQITREPNIPDKRFCAHLFNHEDNKVIDTCLADKDGYYEFYGINEGNYSVLSIDLLNNTVSETIGPIKPMEIV